MNEDVLASDYGYSMWDGPAEEVTLSRLGSLRSLATSAVEPLWPYLADARTPEEFESRMALATENMDSALTRVLAEQASPDDQPIPLGQFRDVVTASLQDRFSALHSEREASEVAGRLAAAQQAAQARTAALRAEPKTAADGLLDGFVPVRWHVYRQDHTGRGLQVSEGDMSSKEQAEVALMGIKERERMNPQAPTLNPNPGFYLVAEDASGQRVPHYGPLAKLPPASSAKHQCEHAGDHHSDDVVAVYHGSTTPTYLCGYHNSQVDDYSKFPRKQSSKAEISIHYDEPYSRCKNCGKPAHLTEGGKGQAVHNDTGKAECAKESLLKGAPFAGYSDFDACLKANADKRDPSAYCGSIQHKVEDSKTSAAGQTCTKCGKALHYTDEMDRQLVGPDGSTLCSDGGYHKPSTSSARHTAGIKWRGETHFGVPFLSGTADNGDIYEVYSNPNSSPHPCSWVNYGPGGDTGPNSGIARGMGYTTMRDAVRGAEAAAEEYAEDSKTSARTAKAPEVGYLGEADEEGFVAVFGPMYGVRATVRTTNGGEVTGIISTQGATYPLDVQQDDGHWTGITGWRVKDIRIEGSKTSAKQGGSFRDFMNEVTDTGTCKHCGKEIEKVGVWQTKEGGPTRDICLANKGTRTQYGGSHVPIKKKTSAVEGLRERVAATQHTADSDWLDVARQVVESKQHQMADGMILDLFSARAMVQVHDALSPENAAKFAAMPLAMAHAIAFKLISGDKAASLESEGFRINTDGSPEKAGPGNEYGPHTDQHHNTKPDAHQRAQRSYDMQWNKQHPNYVPGRQHPKPGQSLQDLIDASDKSDPHRQNARPVHNPIAHLLTSATEQDWGEVGLGDGRGDLELGAEAAFFHHHDNEPTNPHQPGAGAGEGITRRHQQEREGEEEQAGNAERYWAEHPDEHERHMRQNAARQAATSETCWTCGGTGKVNGDRCRACLGKGHTTWRGGSREAAGYGPDFEAMEAEEQDLIDAQEAARRERQRIHDNFDLYGSPEIPTDEELEREGARRQAVNESAYGTERYQKQPTPKKPGWTSDWSDEDAKATKETTDAGMNAYKKPNPLKGLTTTQRERVKRQQVKESASRLAAGAFLDDMGELDAATGEPAVQPVSTQPVTSKPRQKPSQSSPGITDSTGLTPGMEVAPGQMGGGGGFDAGYADPAYGGYGADAGATTMTGDPNSAGLDATMPTVPQLVAAKVARITSRVLDDNPGMDPEQAKALAARTVETYPEMVSLR